MQRAVDQKLVYSPEAIQAGIEGTVVFSVLYDGEGKASDIKILYDPGVGCRPEVLQQLPYYQSWSTLWHRESPISVRVVRYLHYRLSDTSIIYSTVHPDFNGPFDTPLQWEKTNKIYEQFDLSKPASFPGGERDLLQFLQKEINWSVCPKDSLILSIKAIVSFVVDKDGNIWDIRILKSPHPCLNDPILAAIRRMPRWHHAEANGCPVLMRTTIPIRIRWE
jgi:TonB family protein